MQGGPGGAREVEELAAPTRAPWLDCGLRVPLERREGLYLRTPPPASSSCKEPVLPRRCSRRLVEQGRGAAGIPGQPGKPRTTAPGLWGKGARGALDFSGEGGWQVAEGEGNPRAGQSVLGAGSSNTAAVAGPS